MKFKIGCFSSANVMLSLTLVILGPTVVHAEQWLTKHTLDKTSSQPLKEQDLADLAWLEGTWIGEGFGGEIIETWGPPAGGVITGTFRLVEDGKLNFSEYFQLMQAKNGMVLKLKHFDSELNGWEEKADSVDFPLLRVTKKAAWFGGLTYKQTGEETMTVYLAMKKKDGGYKEVEMPFKRSQAVNSATVEK